MTEHPTPAAPSRRPSPLRWVPVVLLILAIPVVIIGSVTYVFRHYVRPVETAGTRQLADVGRALHRYAQAHGGAYPDDLARLADAGNVSPDLLTVSAAGRRVPLVYLGRGLAEQTATNGTVLAHEPPEANAGRGSAVLYADGSTTFLDPPALKDELDRDRKRREPPPEP